MPRASKAYLLQFPSILFYLKKSAKVYMPEFLKTMERKRKAMEAELMEQQAAAENSTPIVTSESQENHENSNLS